MAQAIHTTAGNHCGPRSKRGLEIYLTPPGVTEALLDVEPLPQVIWNSCGTDDDNISLALKAAGKTVIATDIVHDGIDFLDQITAPPGVETIVDNPPFSKAADFVQHGLKFVPKVMVLERIQFLEADVRTDFFNAGKLARVWVFRDRVPRMHRIDWDGKRASPSMTLAWFCFDRDHDGSAPKLGWVRCAPSKKKRGPQ